jgi:hypothetical protein
MLLALTHDGDYAVAQAMLVDDEGADADLAICAPAR